MTIEQTIAAPEHAGDDEHQVLATAVLTNPESTTHEAGTPIDLADLSRRLERVREEERGVLARDLHDTIGGTLTALRIIISRLRKHAGNAPIKTDLDEMASLTDQAASSIQDVIRALRPGILDQGLVAAVEWESRDFQRRSGTVCNFRTNRPVLDIPKAQGVALYRICQEAMTNISKHTSATVVEVVLHRDGDGVSLEVTDNGGGFDVATPASPDSFGIVGMEERLRAYGGWIEISSTPGRGTTVMASVPLRRAQDVVA